MSPQKQIQVLNLEVDYEDVSYFRILVDNSSFKYITIDFGVYCPSDMVWDRALIPLLPQFPEGDWNEGHIGRHPERGTPHFTRYARVALGTISNLWHPTRIDWIDLRRGERLMSNVYTATLLKGRKKNRDQQQREQRGQNKKPTASIRSGSQSRSQSRSPETSSKNDSFIIKYARFPWEIHYYASETAIYKFLEGKGIAPRFLGHLTEGSNNCNNGGRVIGFALERIEHARHAGPHDLEACQEALSKLHRLGILHGDVNRHNFLIRQPDTGGGDVGSTGAAVTGMAGRKIVTIIDFEFASKCTDKLAFTEEMDRLKVELHETDGRGARSIEH